MRKIRIAQIGIGKHVHSDITFDSLLRQSDLFEVSGFFVPKEEEETYEERKNGIYSRSVRLSLEEILADPQLDAVTVECDEIRQTQYAQIFIDKGIAVHMDKPGSPDPVSFEKLMLTAKHLNVPIHLGYMYRYNPVIRQAIEDAHNGAFGHIYSVEAHMDCLLDHSYRQWLSIFPGGMTYYLGCHLIDLVLQLQGIPQKIIPLNASTGIDGIFSEDCGMAALQYPNGISFIKTCAAEPGGFLRRQLVICGSQKTLEIKPLEKYLPVELPENMVTGVRQTTLDTAQKKGWHHESTYSETEPFNRYDTMMAFFASMVRDHVPNPYSCEYEILLHRVLLAACGVVKKQP